ncbi:secretin N-terminal domain-containing protein [Thiolapillus brandeum]|uniref:NolW-like domain-containing protein n=1 Tax=Thiolapillus brandeum TaxID=1076588 RepID=A0A7U6GG28_9GAMM|nr:secretin N-terminal domain-containing protein [Thiolapillus brandeum]BAO42979.1 conserved hypothetical protein [Thiolapillus brandeum]
MKHLLPALLLLISGAWADWPLEIIPLEHQTVDQILPMLKPFAGPDSTVTGMNGQLIIKASPENLAQLKQIIHKFDRAPRQLRISVREQRSATSHHQGISAQGRLPAGEDGQVVIGDPASPEGLEVRIAGKDRNWSTSADRQLRATEGMPAFIQTGMSMPVTTGYRDGWGRFYRERQYQDMTSGFYVTPWVNGDRVTLDIHPFSRQPLNRQGTYRQQEIRTRVTGRLGEWIDLGSVVMGAQGNQRGLSGLSAATTTGEFPMQVKVELISKPRDP